MPRGVHYNRRNKSWEATWTENKKRKNVSFSVQKWGFDRAKELATEARTQHDVAVNTERNDVDIAGKHIDLRNR